MNTNRLLSDDCIFLLFSAADQDMVRDRNLLSHILSG